MPHTRHDTSAGDGAAERRGIVGASTALFDDSGRVLVIRRTKPPFSGVWSLPGGHIEHGEEPAATARRELHEETGLEVAELAFLTRYDVPVRDATGRIERTLGLMVFVGRAPPGAVPRPADDAGAARFVARQDLAHYPLTENCAELVDLAWTRLAAGA